MSKHVPHFGRSPDGGVTLWYDSARTTKLHIGSVTGIELDGMATRLLVPRTGIFPSHKVESVTIHYEPDSGWTKELAVSVWSFLNSRGITVDQCLPVAGRRI